MSLITCPTILNSSLHSDFVGYVYSTSSSKSTNRLQYDGKEYQVIPKTPAEALGEYVLRPLIDTVAKVYSKAAYCFHGFDQQNEQRVEEKKKSFDHERLENSQCSEKKCNCCLETIKTIYPKIAERKEGKPLELESTLENVTIEEEGDLISIAGGDAASKETVDRTTKVTSKIINGETKNGNIVSKATAPKEANKEQLELSVDLDTLRSEISNIAKELKELKLEKEKALEKYTQNESKPKIAESYWEEVEEAKKKIKEKEDRKKVLEGQIDDLLTKVVKKK